ncbi:MAG: 4-hydroxythreonine-4-phosphate dehydrogenase PdxA [Bacteroidetes bacterium]|nr:4-hydroxythreonine-4-phosphate dehydrogenase PdxA [Bacteroidota bacterium]
MSTRPHLHNELPVVGITLGDVNGIGPELAIKAFNDPEMLSICTPVLLGPAKVVQWYRKLLQPKNFHAIAPEQIGKYKPGHIYLVNTSPDMEQPQPGQASAEAGKAAAAALEEAIKQLDAGMLDVLVTLPIEKNAIHGDAFPYPGHTEFLTERLRARQSLMFMIHESLKVAVATNHLPLQEVSRQLTVDALVQKLVLIHNSLKLDFRLQKPRIAVLGLNPHAGDKGLLGKEEQTVILPAIEQVRAQGIFATGPFPADGFFAEHTYRKFDGVLAMYHDQGLIPFKTLAGHEGVNFTAGLPVVRTSPDHGTAFDIAGKGEADATSLRAAIYWAIDIYRVRQDNEHLAKHALKSGAAAKFTSGQDEDAPLGD